MKNTLLILSFLFTLSSWAVEYYPCEITYEDDRTEILEVQFPIDNSNPKLRVKIDGKRASLQKDNIKFFTISLNNDEDKYLFLGGREYSKRGRKKRKVFTLVERVTESGIVIGNLGLAYNVGREKDSDKDIIVFTYLQAHRTYSFSRQNEEIIYPIINYTFGPGLKYYYRKTAEKYQPTLFPDCPDISDLIDYDSIKNKGVETVIEAYEECVGTNNE